jgi:hypothetical protein
MTTVKSASRSAAGGRFERLFALDCLLPDELD